MVGDGDEEGVGGVFIPAVQPGSAVRDTSGPTYVRSGDTGTSLICHADRRTYRRKRPRRRTSRRNGFLRFARHAQRAQDGRD